MFLNVRISWINSELHSLLDRKFDIKVGSLPFSLISKRSFKMPYFHVVSYTFWRSKKIDTSCSFLAKAFQIKVSKRTRWSEVFLPWRNSHCALDKSLLDSRNHTRRALVILSMVLHMQLARAIVDNFTVRNGLYQVV